MKLFILKLGGSLITNKEKAYSPRPEMISSLVSQIKKAYDPSQFHLIIGNGAGSFAHQSAKKYDTTNGFHDEKGAFGACQVHTDAMDLHLLILKECMRQQLPTFSIQPSASIISSGTNETIFFHPVEQALRSKIIPFIYGDVILDEKKGATIYSTDKLCTLLALHFDSLDMYESITILHVGDYEGVLDDKGTLIESIRPQNIEQIRSYLQPTATIDVTGGMLKKVEEAFVLAKAGISTHIINGNTPGIVEKALAGAILKGTLISP